MKLSRSTTSIDPSSRRRSSAAVRHEQVVDDEVAVGIASDPHDVDLDRMPPRRRRLRAHCPRERPEVDGGKAASVVLAGPDLELGSRSECPQVHAQRPVDLQLLDQPALVVDALRGARLERPAVLAVAKDEVTVGDAHPDGANEAAGLPSDDDFGQPGAEDRSPSVHADLDTTAVHPCDHTTLEAGSANA